MISVRRFLTFVIGLLLLWPGVLAAGQSVLVYHLLPRGELPATAFNELSARLGAPVTLRPVPDSLLEGLRGDAAQEGSLEVARERLSEGMASGRLDAYQLRQLDRYLLKTGRQKLAFVVRTADGAAEVVVYRATGRMAITRAADEVPREAAVVPSSVRPRRDSSRPIQLGRPVFPASLRPAPAKLSARMSASNARRGGICLALVSSGFGAAVFWSFQDVPKQEQRQWNALSATTENGVVLRGWLSSVLSDSARLGMPRYGRDAMLSAGVYVGARVIGPTRNELSVFGGLSQTQSQLVKFGPDTGLWQTGIRGRF